MMMMVMMTMMVMMIMYYFNDDHNDDVGDVIYATGEWGCIVLSSMKNRFFCRKPIDKTLVLSAAATIPMINLAKKKTSTCSQTCRRVLFVSGEV